MSMNTYNWNAPARSFFKAGILWSALAALTDGALYPREFGTLCARMRLDLNQPTILVSADMLNRLHLAAEHRAQEVHDFRDEFNADICRPYGIIPRVPQINLETRTLTWSAGFGDTCYTELYPTPDEKWRVQVRAENSRLFDLHAATAVQCIEKMMQEREQDKFLFFT